MTDTVTEVFYWRLKSWAELAEEEDEYQEELQNKNKNKEVKQAGKQLSNFQRRLIDRIKNRKNYVEVGLQKVPSQITVDDIRTSFSSYGIRDCNFKRTNCFFLLPQEQAIRLVEEGKQRITIKGADILIVILPIRNEH